MTVTATYPYSISLLGWVVTSGNLTTQHDGGSRMISKRENGQAMVLTVLFLAGLLGMAALVLDVGSWFREKRQLQLTADASALAGAQALPGSPANATSLAIQYSQTNGRPVTANDVAITSDLSSNDSITVDAKSSRTGLLQQALRHQHRERRRNGDRTRRTSRRRRCMSHRWS